MAEIVISPSGPVAIDADLMIDEAGERFVVLTFREPDADPVLITFPIPLFQAFTAHMRTVEKAALTENGKLVTKTVHRERIAPRSGRHRQMVSDEFRVGLRALTDRVRTLVSRPGIEELWIEPAGKGASIRRGVCAPNGLYRRWGSSIHIDGVLAALRGMHGETLSFASAAAAQGALEAADTAAGSHLAQLVREELAA